ncbi:MAG: tRNA (adenosine(37)-N6)-dimethylallyltransferase MiaA [Planctomycetes bacterium]|nr:tRNA (adenosine(37)-N6)-dimethylallyltransferase MiaA [Planctomycetota bacterium]
MLRIIIGQTASGKSALASRIANQGDYEIISADSMKIYRGMDIGTSKPFSEQQKKLRYHLIDIVEPHEEYNVAKFVRDCDKAIADINKRDRKPLLVCGTPMYLKAWLYGIFSGSGTDSVIRAELEKAASEKGLAFLYEQLIKVDPAKADKIHANDRKRIIRALEVYRLTGKTISSLQTHFSKTELRYSVKMVGLKWKPEELYLRIDERVERMFNAGLVEEVKGLINSGKGLGKQAGEAIGYKEVIRHLNGEITLEVAKEEVKKGTRYLARKQMTWFRRFPDIKWIECKPGDDTERSYKIITEALG